MWFDCKKFSLVGSVGALMLSSSGIALNAQDMAPSLNQYGTTGLIDMPSAESQPDAELSATVGGFGGAVRSTFTFQILPRLSGSFRYAKVPDFYDDETIYDRSFDLQYRLLDERKYIPSVAVGLRDFMGTGIYSGQYVVATKNVHPKLKVTAGLGWGRFSDTNDLQPIDPTTAGKPNVGSWFKGPVGAFGGLEWETPLRGLRAKVEYSSDKYTRENELSVVQTEVNFERKSPVNFGLEYTLRSGVKFGAHYMYGSEIGFSFSTTLNPKRSNGVVDRAPRRVSVRKGAIDRDTSWTQTAGINAKAREQLNALLKTDNMIVETLNFTGTKAEVRLRNNKYKAVPQAIGRTARAMARVFPDSVETFTIIPIERGVATSAMTIKRADIEALENHPNASTLMAQRVEISDAAPAPKGSEYTPGLYPRFEWSLAPYAQIVVFDSQKVFDANAGLRLSAKYNVMPGLSFSGSIKKNILGNLDADSIQKPSGLPRVRTDIKKYRENGDPALERLTGEYVFKLRPDTYGRVTVGYLESMYGGISGEVLWKQADRKWGLGAEINYVKQRDFDQLFGFQDYSIVTGHASAYFELGNNFEAQVDVGRYLAGDIGATLSVDRVFGNGWRVGAYATKTNVSSEDFGEGSFDKGISIDIPLSWALGTPSKRVVSNKLASLTRDGGARLNVDNRLYGVVRDSHGSAISGAWGRFWR